MWSDYGQPEARQRPAIVQGDYYNKLPQPNVLFVADTNHSRLDPRLLL